jgi:hypothetical protein
LWKNRKDFNTFCLYTLSACILYSLISIMTAGLVRYRVPFLDPLLIILASVTVFKIYSHFTHKKLNLK